MPENPICIAFHLINRLRSFQNSWVFETDLFDFHKMTVTVIKILFQQLQRRIINYRDN